MKTVVRLGDREYEVDVSVDDGSALVSDLAEAIHASGALVVDGRLVGPSVPLAELDLGDGSIVTVPGNGEGAPTGIPRHGAFSRPPRLVAEGDASVLDPPVPQDQPAQPMRFGWGAMVVPLLLGLAMAVFVHPRMAAFALFSPAMLVANWLEDRRRVRKQRRDSGEAFADALQRFSSELAAANVAETRRRRDAAVEPAELLARAEAVDPRLWERRPHHTDFMVLPIGTGCLAWQPPLRTEPVAELASMVARFSVLHDVPVPVELHQGEVIGVAGDRSSAVGMVRQLLLQAAVHHGPADLAVTLFTECPDEWDWLKWLPHVGGETPEMLRIAATPTEIASMASSLAVSGTGTRHLVVVDLPAVGRRAEVREVLRRAGEFGIAAVAIAPDPLHLPSVSTTIIEVESSRLRAPDGSETSLTLWTIPRATARRVARALARIDDPEVATAGIRLPASIHLASLLGLGAVPEPVIATRWRQTRPQPTTPVGAGDDGPVVIDLVADGPHALIGGTTGSGKSELLKSLVAGLAVAMSPAALNFVFIDYKGGSAFDACARLPHTAGLVTDLDGHLAQRALVCLEAELRYREKQLRDVGVAEIDSYPDGLPPLPRLVVVIDEFAALAAELPEFMEALVGIAQRGRSLGVHLVLATQRPAGVVSDNIRANTNLRIALRVQDAADSVDVIDTGEAARISRSHPGRGLVRRGHGEIVGMQTALVTGRSMTAGADAVAVRPFVAASEQPAVRSAVNVQGTSTDLELIVAACRTTATSLGLDPPRMPWPDPLPAVVCREEIPGSVEHAVFGLVDEPQRQRQIGATWHPGAGNLLLYGLPGSGTTTALAALALGMSAAWSPDDLHIHVLDFDDQLLGPLRDLPHVGSVVAGSDGDRQTRLLRRLTTELDERRRQGSSEYPVVVTMIDNYARFSDSYAEPGDMAVHTALARLVADGPGVGMMTIVTAKQPGDIPSRVAATVPNRLGFRLVDRFDYGSIGLPVVEPPQLPGRAFESASGREVQVALPHRDGLGAAVAAAPDRPVRRAPWSIATLPDEVPVSEFVDAGKIAPEGWFLPLGIGDSSLVPVGLVLRDGEHALIAGPPHSGKTTALLTVARVARAADDGLHIAAIAPRRSRLSASPAIDEIIAADRLTEAELTNRRTLLLVDDAELVDDDGTLRELLRRQPASLRIVAAGSPDVIRGLYGHWTQDLRRSRIGCALRPSSAADGDLWQVQLPRPRHGIFPAGRGYLLAGGHAELVQLGHD